MHKLKNLVNKSFWMGLLLSYLAIIAIDVIFLFISDKQFAWKDIHFFNCLVLALVIFSISYSVNKKNSKGKV